VKNSEEIVEILEAYDLAGSFRAAAELVGCDHHTVARYVRLRELGRSPDERTRREQLIDPWLPKLEEWVERSGGRIGADVAHRKLAAMGYAGSERTTRRAVATVKRSWRAGHRRVFRPWVPEPGLWLQFDWGAGPRIGRRATWLWCAWLAWSRFRVVLPAWDRTLPSVLGCLDATLRRVGGVPTYALTDNERTVTVDHVARIPVRHPDIVAAGRHYGLAIRTCVPADPQSKGGSEATVRIAKRDLVPTEVNLRAHYASFGELQAACDGFGELVNTRPHRVTGRVPVELLAEELQRLHPLPAEPVAVAFGQTRAVSWDGTVSFGGVRYSVPHTLVETVERVWVREAGEEVIVTVVEEAGPREVARHGRGQRGQAVLDGSHYPQRTGPAGERTPQARTAAEQAFLAIGQGARSWLVEAAAAGAARVRGKMAEAVSLAKLHGSAAVDQALGSAALAGRFGDADLLAILTHQLAGATVIPTRASETHSLQPGTSAWAQLGTGTASGTATTGEVAR
jgi:transposase